MGLLPTVSAPSASDRVNAIKQINLNSYNQRVMMVKQTFSMVWKDPKFTAAEIVTAMGTDAGLMFQEHGLEQQALARIAQESGMTYTALVPLHKITPVLDGNNNPTGALTVDTTQPYGA